MSEENNTEKKNEESKALVTDSVEGTVSQQNIEPQTENQFQTEKMEVHHPHHVTLKKKWTELSWNSS